MSQNIHLNLAIHSTNAIALTSRTLSINGSANLLVRGTADNPVVLGRVNLTGGDMILNGDRFLLTGGTIQFVNPTQTESVVNATITTTIQQYNISMRFRGPTDHMETQYSSDPALPWADCIHLLAFGNTTEAAANAPATPANQMAESLVADQLSSQITSRVARVAGISQPSITRVLGNAQNSQNGADITIQQRVTGNLFITFSDNAAQATQSRVNTKQHRTCRLAHAISKRRFCGRRSDEEGVLVRSLIAKFPRQEQWVLWESLAKVCPGTPEKRAISHTRARNGSRSLAQASSTSCMSATMSTMISRLSVSSGSGVRPSALLLIPCGNFGTADVVGGRASVKTSRMSSDG